MPTQPRRNRTCLLIAAAIALAGPLAFSQPAEKTRTESDLLNPSSTSGLNDPSRKRGITFGEPGSERKPGEEKKERNGVKKDKGPTEITALEATFDQKAHVAIFTGSVVVKDPEFNVTCDKLTAHLKHNGKPAAAAENGPKTKASPVKTDEAAPAAKKGMGGLERAIAEGNVVITQDKAEADGTITHCIGIAKKANYDVATGEIVLTGKPEVTQGVNTVVATDEGTVMTLTRDGHMKTLGPHKMVIKDQGNS